MESLRFEADVQQILNLVTHSLYSNREIFLRELISNASDALDRARFASLQSDTLREADGEAAIRIAVDADKNTITISDNGIGLTRAEAIEQLGTIARSGTAAFAKVLAESGEDPEGLVGQFGVGFYASFMVAETVVVHTSSAQPESEPVRWSCTGGATYDVEPGDRTTRGTDVTLHLKPDATEYLDEEKLREIVHEHSDFVPWPVYIGDERANQETALWSRTPRDVTDEEYGAFYKHLTKDYNEPLLRAHVRAEGTLEFDAILFVPSRRPWTMDGLDATAGVQLYQKRIKVLENAKDLLPRYLRFVHGVVDSKEVQLNVSREILQQTPVVGAIRKQLTKRVLKRLVELARDDAEAFVGFWGEFGHILKEGFHEDPDSRDTLLSLLRFRTTRIPETLPTSDEDTSPADPVSQLRSLRQIKDDMADGQEAIWFYTDVDKQRIGVSPVLEGFRRRGWEVILMDDPVDEWVTIHVREFDGVPLESAAHGEAPAETEDDEVADAARKQAAPLITWLNELLDGEVSSVRISNRLTDSPSVLVNQTGAMGANLERILQHANQEVTATQRVLEINPEHPMVCTLAKLNAEGKPGLELFARLLLDHAMIAEGKLDDPAGFAKRLHTLMEKASSAL